MMTMATTTHVSEHQYSLIRDMIKSGKSLSDIHDWNNGMSDRIHKRTLKKLYNTIARAEENELTASLARAEAAEQRVAELEAQLAAQGWRPVTEDWPPYGESVLVRMLSGAIRWGYRRGDRWHLGGAQYSRESVTHAYVLPPPPDAATTEAHP